MKTFSAPTSHSSSACSSNALRTRSLPWGPLSVLLTGAVSVVVFGSACSTGAGGGVEGDRNGDGVVDEADGTGGSGSSGGVIVDDWDTSPPGCGNGILTDDEACDDGGTVDGDGCAADCRSVDPGFVCPVAGELCIPFARCGDGVTALPEQCDVGPFVDGDGCTDDCKLEQGWACDGSPSTCHETVCGDGNQEGTETCEDDDLVPFDGCDANCQAEPACTDEGCTSACGDGILIDEACDDGNSIDGDGCSSTCEKEDGYECNQAECERVDGECVLRIPAVYRDFNAYSSSVTPHPDFRTHGGSYKTGIVAGLLSDAGKPQLAVPLVTGVRIEDQASFAEWYTDVPGVNSTLRGELVLFANGSGAFVNRLTADGEQYVNPLGITHDGSPLFFPFDGAPNCAGAERLDCALPDTRYVAQVPDEVYDGNWAEDPSGLERNFHFTSEIAYWFVYNEDEPATLTFAGDDDVWVFINRRLAIDLGGAHVPMQDDVTIGPATADDFALTDGGVYEIRIFHAERNEKGSSFKLTLGGFDTSPSVCKSNCGDGIVGVGEECDDGINDGGYNECQPECQLGSYCGDGTKDPGEDCDDGNRVDGDGCGNSCRVIVIR